MNRIVGTTLTAVAVWGSGATALAQSTDEYYLNDLYNFLNQQDALAHEMATYLGDDWNIVVGRAFCADLNHGYTPQAIMEGFQAGVSAATQDLGIPEVEYAASLYGGSMMNLGVAYYCPQYSDAVQAYLSSL